MRISLLPLLLLFHLSVLAQPADSIRQAAQDPDFITVSLITVGPGDKVYTTYGHSALRLQCPSAKLDYCFTFEMALAAGETMRFLFSTAKAGFIAAATESFFESYRVQGRSIHEQPLNLLPQEEQQLWRLLDEEMQKGAHWDYDVMTTHCSSMCIWAVSQALLTAGEHLEFKTMPQASTGSYRTLLEYMSPHAPWSHLFWYLRIGADGKKTGKEHDMLPPCLIEEGLAGACIVDSSGHSRPVFAGQMKVVALQTSVSEPPFLTPMKVLWAIIIIVISLLLFKNKNFMKKITSKFFGSRAVLSAMFLTLSSLSAMAGGDDWYAFKVQAEAYPTGAGVVYLTTESEAPAESYVATQELEITSTSTTINGFARANEGWQLLGFAKDTIDASGNRCMVDEVTSNIGEESGIAYLTLDNGVTSKHFDETQQAEVSDDSLTVASLMPLEPNNYFRALFTHVKVQLAKQSKYMGRVSISKLCNEIGDKVTITAEARNGFCTFQNWTLNGQEVSTQPSLEVEVKGVATYEANFVDSRSVTINFPAEGGYVEWMNPYSFDFFGQVNAVNCPTVGEGYENHLVDLTNADKPLFTPITTTYGTFGNQPAIIYGKGTVTGSPSSDEEAEPYYYDTPIFHWSGEAGVMVDTLSQDQDKYYAFDATDGSFVLTTTGVIAAKKVYLQMPDSLLAGAANQPQKIYLDTEEIGSALGIAAAPVVRQSLSRSGIYSLSGRRMDAISREGIYIFDGKKVVYRKK